jgi:Zn-dependent protease with chaperone function
MAKRINSSLQESNTSQLLKMQNYINQIASGFGRVKSILLVSHTSSQTYANATGFNILGTLIGTIYVNMELVTENVFTSSEIRFILAHEYTHIFKNHAIANILSNGVEIFLRGPNNERSNIGDLARSLLQPAIFMNQEYEADLGAFQITQDLNSTMTCLTKLVGGEFFFRPSHTWELQFCAQP